MLYELKTILFRKFTKKEIKKEGKLAAPLRKVIIKISPTLKNLFLKIILAVGDKYYFNLQIGKSNKSFFSFVSPSVLKYLSSTTLIDFPSKVCNFNSLT